MQIGETIRERIVPNAVLWFTGQALDYEGDDYGGYEGDDGEEVGALAARRHSYARQGDDDEDSDNDPDYKPPAAGAQPAAGQKPECKNQ